MSVKRLDIIANDLNEMNKSNFTDKDKIAHCKLWTEELLSIAYKLKVLTKYQINHKTT